jgi:hypothetical protein
LTSLTQPDKIPEYTQAKYVQHATNPMSFANLKKQSSLGSLTSKLVNEVEKMNKTGGGGDDRLWKPELDKTGNGYAVIRFLPAPDGEDLPWAKIYTHAFQGPGGWYIENSLTTLNQKDPVSEYNRELWNSGSDNDKETVRKQKRKLSYYSNIYVVKDPTNPQNEGKVFLFKYGKKIFDKVMAAMQPEFEDETPINPFDFWAGANFKLKIRKVDGYWNYDKSEFDSTVALLDDDDALESLWKKEYALNEILAPAQFKDYDALKKRLDAVLGVKPASRPRFNEETDNEDNDRGTYAPDFSSRNKESELPQDIKSELNNLSSSSSAKVEESEDEDDALSYFQRLADS